MKLIGLSVNDDDDPVFIRLAQRLIHGVVATHKPAAYCVVRIDNWFGERWLNFSGKILGALGVRKAIKPTFPPFVPNRIKSYALFNWNAKQDDYEDVEEPCQVHKWQRSEANLYNYVGNNYPNAAFFWFSSSSKLNGRGSFMSYVSNGGECWTWYLEFQKKDEWKQSKRANISADEVDFLLGKCLGHEKGPCPQ